MLKPCRCLASFLFSLSNLLPFPSKATVVGTELNYNQISDGYNSRSSVIRVSKLPSASLKKIL